MVSTKRSLVTLTPNIRHTNDVDDVSLRLQVLVSYKVLKTVLDRPPVLGGGRVDPSGKSLSSSTVRSIMS